MWRPLIPAHNAGMPYYEFMPDPRLRKYVHSICVQVHDEARPDWPATTILPLGKVEMIFNFADPLVQVEDGVEIPIPAHHFMGQRWKPVNVRMLGKTGLVIVVFHSWCSDKILSGQCVSGEDQFVDLRDMFVPRQCDQLEQCLSQPQSIDARVRCVQDFVASVLQWSEPDLLVEAAVSRIVRSGSRVRVGKLASEFGITRRHLNRRYAAATGIAPKRHAGIVRAVHAAGLLRSDVDKQVIIEKCGFYDQPHMTREIRSYCGITPDQLRRRPVTPLQQFCNSASLEERGGTVYI